MLIRLWAVDLLRRYLSWCCLFHSVPSLLSAKWRDVAVKDVMPFGLSFRLFFWLCRSFLAECYAGLGNWLTCRDSQRFFSSNRFCVGRTSTEFVSSTPRIRTLCRAHSLRFFFYSRVIALLLFLSVCDLSEVIKSTRVIREDRRKMCSAYH